MDTAKIGIHQLRSQIAVIPQEVYLMDQSLLKNIDPNHTHSLEFIISTLDRLNFFAAFDYREEDHFQAANDPLDHSVEDTSVLKKRMFLNNLKVTTNPSNLSQGQR